MTKPLQSYKAPGIVVTFDQNVYRHTGICLQGQPSAFDIRRKRWVRPELGSPEDLAAQVARCPSGALQCRLTSKTDDGVT